MRGYDAWKTTPPEPDEAPIVGECIHCKGDIHAGDTIYRLDAKTIVCDDCWTDYAMEALDACRMEAETDDEPDEDPDAYDRWKDAQLTEE